MAESVVKFKVMFGKTTYDIEMDTHETVGALKAKLEPITGVPVAMQKLTKGGILKDEETLEAKGITNGTKLMLIGSKVSDIIAVASTTPTTATSETPTESKVPLSKQTAHQKVLAKGVPEDAEPGLKGRKLPLPTTPLKGILTKAGKVRLTFKRDTEELWIGSNTSTQKIPFSSIRAIHSEPIEGHEEYHIMALQIGPTEASRYYLYYVPAQYVESIKDTILGGFVFF